MEIQKRLEKLENMENVTKETIMALLEFWKSNRHIIGNELGDFKLKDLHIGDSYGSRNYDTNIFYYDKVLGYGYIGEIGFGRYTTYQEYKKASRDIHVRFIKNFKEMLEKELEYMERVEQEINNLCKTVLNKIIKN